jgi:hypothetical protein
MVNILLISLYILGAIFTSQVYLLGYSNNPIKHRLYAVSFGILWPLVVFAIIIFWWWCLIFEEKR